MNPRNLWIYYAAAIATVLTLLVAGHAIHMRVLSLGAQDEETINISGRQRMLSQRVLLAATKFANDADPLHASILTSALDAMEQGHTWLLANAVVGPAARDHYFAPDGVQLDLRTRNYIALGRSVLTEANGRSAENSAVLISQMASIALNDLLRDLNEAVGIFEAAANTRTQNLISLQVFTLLSAIAVLLLEAAFVFRPAYRAVVKSLNAVEARNEELSNLTKRLEFSAFHDPLTGLGNRKKLHVELSAKLERLNAGVNTVCVMHLDLDGFKGINDTLGHACGDDVLKRIAAILLASVPDGSVVARVGGDEFVIVMDVPANESEATAQEVSAEILHAVQRPMQLGDETRTVGISIGYTFSGDQGVPGDVLIANADIALYAAKRAGKGIAKSFDTKMRTDLEHHEKAVQELRRAVFSQEFVPFYQPKMSLRTGEVVGFEMLARWQHPEEGLLTPNRFVEAAETVGLLDAIDGQLLFAALDHFQEFIEVCTVRPKLAFNASAGTLLDDTLADNLLSVISSAALDPSDFIVEIVETVTIEGSHGNKVARNISKLRQSGFGVHIDDFGTGFASLENIARLDVTGLKLDKSIVKSIDDPKFQQIAQAVCGLSSSTSIELVAEGIETQDQAFMLREIGFDVVQGFLFARPMPKEDCLTWLKARKDLGWVKSAS